MSLKGLTLSRTVQCHRDLIVIGGGVLGAFFAYHAQAKGLKVTLLEKNSSPRGATVRNFGQVVPSGLTRSWQTFGRHSLQIYKSIQADFDISVRQLGTVYLASDEEELALLEELHVRNNEVEYPSELWTARRALERFPQLRSEYCRGALFFPEEVSVNPRLMIHRLHDYLAEQPGFESKFQTQVNGVFTNEQNEVTVTTADGREFMTKKVILCSGSEFEILFPELFRESDLVAVKLQMLRLSPQANVQLPGNILTGRSIRRYESFSECPSWEAIKSREAGDTFCDQWGIHILFKQEADGGIILGDSHEYAPARERDRLGFDLRRDINDALIQEAARIFSLPSWEIESAWSGMYCQTNNPVGIYLNQVSDNIHIVTGIGGKGMTSSAGFAFQYLKELYND